jgi:hypothetical protein
MHIFIWIAPQHQMVSQSWWYIHLLVWWNNKQLRQKHTIRPSSVLLGLVKVSYLSILKIFWYIIPKLWDFNRHQINVNFSHDMHLLKYAWIRLLQTLHCRLDWWTLKSFKEIYESILELVHDMWQIDLNMVVKSPITLERHIEKFSKSKGSFLPPIKIFYASPSSD